jgi:hypothetical protein
LFAIAQVPTRASLSYSGAGLKLSQTIAVRVLRTFIWGFPHQYRTPAPVGTAIALQIAGAGAWVLTRTATGWSLDEGQAAAPAASLRISGEAAWRLLTGARYDARQVHLSGDPALAEPLLRVRGIIV